MIITKQPIEVILDGRGNKKFTSLVALDIVNFTRNKEFNYYQFEVVDYKVYEENEKKIYEEFDRNVRKKTFDEMSQIWSLTGDKSTPEKFDLALDKGLLLETQNEPVHGTTPEVWELHVKEV